MIIFLLFSSTPSTPHFTLFPYTTLFRSLPQRGHDLLAVAGVQRRGRLIAQQDPRPGRQGPGDRHALLLTAGELAGVLVAMTGYLHEVEHLHHGLGIAAEIGRAHV